MQIVTSGSLLDQIKSKLLRKFVYLALVRIIEPSGAQIDLTSQVRGIDAQSLAADSVAGFENDNRMTSFMDIDSGAKTRKARADDNNVDFLGLV
jgi:hypothetical protein